MAEETYLQQTQQLLPEYQEAFLKSLLFSAFDPYGGYVTDAQGNVLREARQGDALAEGETFVSQPTGLATESPLSTVPEQTLAKFGYRDPQTGEVSYSGFTPSQTAALQLGVGQIGGYQPMFDAASQTFAQGLGTYGEAELDAAPGDCLPRQGQALLPRRPWRGAALRACLRWQRGW